MSIIGDVPWGTHFCHFYETKQDLLDTLVPYFKAGLESKEFCLWVVSNSELITVEEARAALEQAVPDFDRHLSEGNIEILDGHDWYFEKNVLNLERVTSAWDAKVKRALARGYDGLRASADTFWLAKQDWKDFIAYEKQVNDWITDQTMTVLCTYPLAKSGAAEVLDIVDSHQFAIARRQGEWKVIQSPELIQAKAEIERLNEALQRVINRPPKPRVILSYVVAVLSVTAALIITLWMRMELGQSFTPIVALFLCSVMFSAWFGGVGPGLLATALSLLALDYYFVIPLYSFAIEIKEIPRFLVFALSALLVGLLSAAQRSKADSLRRARDVLDETVQEVKRTNVALRAEITERKRAEALLHAQEQVFRAIVENAPDQIIRYDRDFRRTYVNPAVARFYGMPAETLIGKPLGSGIPEAGLAVKEGELAEVCQRIAAVFETGKSYEYELTWTLPTGRSSFSIRLFPELDLNGSVVNVLGISRDITERKQIEQRLREYEKAVEGLDEMIVVIDRDRRFLLANRAYLAYRGLEREQLVGRRVSEVLSPRVFESVVKEKLDQCFDGKVVKYAVKYNYPELGERDIFVSHFPIEGPTGIDRVACVLKDITESKRAEEALKESQRRLEEAQRIAHVGHWERDLETGVITWSDEIYRILGLPPQEDDSPPTEWRHMIHPEDRGRVALVTEEAQRGVRRYDVEYRIVRPDGKVRFLHSQGDIIRDEQGRPRRAFGIAQDITERKSVEERLKQSESQLAEAQHLARVGSWNWDLQSNTLNWSDELYRIFGVDPLVYSPIYEEFVMEFAHTEDRALVRGAIESSLKTQKPFSFSYRILRPDGEERVIHARGNIVSNEHGNPIRIYGTAQDVTERKQAEEALRRAEQKYRDIFENAGEGIFQSTPDGRYIVVNPALARMYRFASPEELIHIRQDISRQVYVDPTRREEFKRQIEEQGAVRGFEHEVFRKDDSKLWISVNARAVQDEQGAIQYYEGTIQDITERKAAEEKLKASSEQLRALSARLQSAREEEGARIGREIHDELGAALTSLRWDLESVDKAISQARDQSQLQLLRERIESMIRLTDTTIGAVRRISSELRPSVLDDLGLVEAIEWQAEQFQARTGIICRCDCSLESLALSWEQSTAIFRILQEALTNVLRHAQATNVDISLKEEEGEFVLTIIDNGRGITENEKSGSQSLGLLGMQERAHLIGGKININGVIGEGTMITVRVPISR
jgi:PAS domain S-box-containing protein